MSKTWMVGEEVKEQWIRRIGNRYRSDQIPEEVKLPEATVPSQQREEQVSSARLMVRLEAVRVLLEEVF
jgi:hypothetical protein